ncbi:biotin biosynthesis protein BioC [Rickettsiales bacterium Ac37b]|nr:biotin biosynthesis protein BioC [Rickettsiales bacterium Ac37b]
MVEQLFNKKLLRLRRNRIASNFYSHDFLIKLATQDIEDRLKDFNRDFFTILDLGCHTKQLLKTHQDKEIIHFDCAIEIFNHSVSSKPKVIGDTEWVPFADNIFDLVVSVFNFHFVNDLVGTLVQLKNSLKNNGILMASMLGGNTLYELRQALLEAEIFTGTGVSPHIIPFVDIKDIGAVLQRAGFSLPVVDSYVITVSYDNIIHLMYDLRYMGATNILYNNTRNYLGKKVLMKADEIYKSKFFDDENKIEASFEIITMIGLKD